MSWILPQRPYNKPLAAQTRQLTLSLYRTLLRTAYQFDTLPQQWFLKHTIRERFRFHQHETSRKTALTLLCDGDKALQQMKLALKGDMALKRYIDDLAHAKIGPLAHAVNKLKRIPNLLERAIAAADIRSEASKRRHNERDRITLPSHLLPVVRLSAETNTSSSSVPTVPATLIQYRRAVATLEKQKQRQRQQRRKRLHALKPYQVKIITQTSSGYTFVRRRGFRQPLGTSMTLKKRARTIQKKLDFYYHLAAQRDYMKSEQLFYQQLGIKHDMNEYIRPIADAIKQNNKSVRPTIPSIDT